ncbi:hypothetical protein MASR2M66_24480 [Chloroflexota bacterium]
MSSRISLVKSRIVISNTCNDDTPDNKNMSINKYVVLAKRLFLNLFFGHGQHGLKIAVFRIVREIRVQKNHDL